MKLYPTGGEVEATFDQCDLPNVSQSSHICQLPHAPALLVTLPHRVAQYTGRAKLIIIFPYRCLAVVHSAKWCADKKEMATDSQEIS